VRIENVDRPREVAGAAQAILSQLRAFGFKWDGEIVRQSDRNERYLSALERLATSGLTFACSCSRATLGGQRYPGTCRNSGAYRQRVGSQATTATRLRIEPGTITVADQIQGGYTQDIAAASGDLILRRRDGIIAYLLAVVADDADQGVTHVVRGADLLEHTPAQIYLQRALRLATPIYAHVPALVEADGMKLAKSRRSLHLVASAPEAQLMQVFELLGLQLTGLQGDGLPRLWDRAISRWRIEGVPKLATVRVGR
jgi:glutamyl-Q tRNA(Asp) synthetase